MTAATMSYKYEELKNAVMRFRVADLQTFLGYAGLNKQGRKSLLQRRALEFLKADCSPSTELKINEIYQRMHSAEIIDIELPVVRRNRNLVNYYEHDDYESPSNSPVRDNWLSQEGRLEPIPYYPMFTPPIMSPTLSQFVNRENNANSIPIEPRPLFPSWNLNNRSSESFQLMFQMMRLPFFELKSTIRNLTVMRNRPSDQDEEMNEFHSDFTLKPHEKDFLLSKRLAGRGRDLRVHLRICSFEVPNKDVGYSKTDNLPAFLAIKINGDICDLPPVIPSTNRQGKSLRRINAPIDITDYIHNRDDCNYVTFLWEPDGAKQFAYSVDLVRKRNCDELVRELKEKPYSTIESAINRIKGLLASDDDIETTSLKMSIFCPLTKNKMKLPTKSIHCNHAQCFDAVSFIQMNEVHSKWICPVCNKQLKFDDLAIDQYFLNILQSERLSENAKTVLVYIDGNWDEVREQPVQHRSRSVRLQQSESDTDTDSPVPYSSYTREKRFNRVEINQKRQVIISNDSSESEVEYSRRSRRRKRSDAKKSKDMKKGRVLDMHINALRKKAEFEYNMRSNVPSSIKGHSSSSFYSSERNLNVSNSNERKNIVLVDLTGDNEREYELNTNRRSNKRKYEVILSSSDSSSDTDTSDETTSSERDEKLSVLGRACLYSVNVNHGEIVSGSTSSQSYLHSNHGAKRYSPPCYIIE